MNELFEASWRIYPGAALVVLGVLIALRGFGAEMRAFRSAPGDPATPLAMMRGFRRGIFGFAVAALAAAWLWQLGWLAILAGIIAGKEPGHRHAGRDDRVVPTRARRPRPPQSRALHRRADRPLHRTTRRAIRPLPPAARHAAARRCTAGHRHAGALLRDGAVEPSRL